VGRPLVALALALVTPALVAACAAPTEELGQPATKRIVNEDWPDGPLTAPSRAPKPGELEWYLDRLPHFGPAPAPQPVWLSRYEGQAALVPQIPTSQPVAFITIDDGAFRHPMMLDLITAAKVPVTLFLTTNYVTGNEAWFAALLDTGYVTIHNHTVSHPNLKTGGYEVARNQLCIANDRLAAAFGQRPTYFRPPYGEYDATTLQAAWACGLQAGFHWRETVDGGTVYYQRDHGRIHAGDIILMHFRPAFPDDFLAILQAIKASGLVPARLEDYVRVGDGLPLPPPPEPSPDP
jgi:peptidoglycan/xylan/chitin deacetylase (PgdA/CDA1 family)